MLYMATHYWQVEDEETLKQRWAVMGTRTFMEWASIESKGLGKAHGFWLTQTSGNIMAWCLWETENIEALEAYGNQVLEAIVPSDWKFRTEVTPVEQVYPLPDEANLPGVTEI